MVGLFPLSQTKQFLVFTSYNLIFCHNLHHHVSCGCTHREFGYSYYSDAMTGKLGRAKNSVEHRLGKCNHLKLSTVSVLSEG